MGTEKGRSDGEGHSCLKFFLLAQKQSEALRQSSLPSFLSRKRRVQRQNEALPKVFLPSFLSRKK